MCETWKYIDGQEGRYQVSDKGRFRSLERIDAAGHRIKGCMPKPRKSKNGMVYVSMNNKTESLSRLIAKTFIAPVDGLQVDHIDGNRLNNNIENLRVVEGKINMLGFSTFRKSKSKYRGVSSHGKKWQSYVKKDSIHYHLGLYDCEIEAAKVRDARALELGFHKNALNKTFFIELKEASE